MMVVDNSLFSLLIVVVLMLLSFGYSSPKARSIHVLQLLLSAQVLQRQFNAEKGGSWQQHAAFGLACVLLLGMFANALIIEMNVLGSNHLSPLSSLKLSLLIFTGVAVQFILVAIAMNVVKIADASNLFLFSLLQYARFSAYLLLPLVSLILFGKGILPIISFYLASFIILVLSSLSFLRTVQLALRMKIKVLSLHYLLYLCFLKGAMIGVVYGGFLWLFP